jgi:hypothetical protein
MCDPVTLFGTSAAGIAGGGAAVGGIQTIGLLGASGVFAPFSGSIATGIGSAFSGMGSGGLFNVLSLGSNLYGTAQSTAVQQANYEYQAQMREYDRVVADNNARSARLAARFESDVFEERLRALKGTQNVKYAKSGVVINQDTPLDVAADTAAKGEMERLAILYRGETEAKSYEMAAAGNQSAAARLRANAETASAAGNIAMISDVAKAGYRQYRNTPGKSLLS